MILISATRRGGGCSFSAAGLLPKLEAATEPPAQSGSWGGGGEMAAATGLSLHNVEF